MKTVAVIVQDGFAPFEFGVACEAFGLDRSDDGIPNFDFRIVTPNPGVVQSKLGFSLNVEQRPGVRLRGRPRGRLADAAASTWARTDERVLDVVRDAVARGAWVLSVCSGSFILGAAGVLDGRKATTHWMYADAMARMYPKVDVDPDVLYVQDGRIITSAGTAAGLDACLHLLRQELGAEMTNRIARRMVVPPQRDGGQAQFIRPPLPAGRQSLSLAPVTDWMLDNLRQRAHGRPARRQGAHVAAHVRPPLQGRLRRDPGGVARPAAHHPRAASARADRPRPRPHRVRDAASARHPCCARTSPACSARRRPRIARRSAARSAWAALPSSVVNVKSRQFPRPECVPRAAPR